MGEFSIHLYGLREHPYPHIFLFGTENMSSEDISNVFIITKAAPNLIDVPLFSFTI